MSPALAGGFLTTAPPGKPQDNCVLTLISGILSNEPGGGAGSRVGSRAACTEPTLACTCKDCSVASESHGIPEPILVGE